jgi:hypothetical protein
MVRWMRDSKWVRAITENDEYNDDGKVGTRLGMGADYYHLCEALR